MNLIPPTHGHAAVRTILPRAAIEADPAAEDVARSRMLASLHRLFEEKFAARAPEDWISWTVLDTPVTGDVEIRLSAEAPATARRYFDTFRNAIQETTVPVSRESRIPIVRSAYRYEDSNPFRRDDHVLTFQGWDVETGLMVFDR